MQLQEGQHIPPESLEWNQHDQAIAPSTPTGSSFKRWTTTDHPAQPSSYPNSPPYHPQYHPQAFLTPQRTTPPVSPSRKSFSSAVKHKSTNNTCPPSPNSTYGYSTYRSSHHQKSDYYGSSPPTALGSSTSKIPTYQPQHRVTITDTSFSSTSRAYQQDPGSSPSLMQSMNAFSNRQGSPRMGPKPPPKRREHAQPSAGEGELHSLDQYEAMLQQMASSGLRPSSPKETRPRRTENVNDRSSRRVTRQERKQQQQGQLSSEAPNSMMHSPEALETKSDPSKSMSDRKLRRRSSMPTFGDFPIRALTELKRRSSEYRIPHDPLEQMHWPGSIDNEQSGSNGRSREHASILRSNNMIGGKENIKDGSSSALQYLEDRNKTAHSVQGPDQQVRNKRTSRRLSQPGTGPALRSSRLTDSGVSVTHTVDHCASNFSLDEGDRRIEQYQMELRQLQTEVPGPRTYQGGAKSPNISATRPRASADAGSSIPQASPSQQQLLTSLKEGGSSSTSSLQSMRPTSPRTRPTTPIRPPPPSPTTPIRPPPPSPTTPARPPHPSPSMSPSIVSTPVVVINGTYSPANNKKASLPNGRRVKPSPPVSSSLSPPTAPRPRAASVTTINSMNSKGNFNVEGGVHQAPPSVPLPSVPPQVSPAHQSVSYLSADDSLNHRHKKLTEASPGTLNAPPSSQFMSAELEEMALLSTLNSRTGMAAELEAVKRQLVEKEDIITRLTMEHQKQRQQQQEQQVQNSRVVADEVSSSKQEISNLEDVRSKLEKELASAVSEIQRLRQMREDQEHDQRNIRQELIILRTECATEREAYSVLEQELEAFKARSQEEQEVHSRDLQETVQRFTYQISQLEDQHSSEMQKLQRDHDELLEAMVLKHANALTDLSEQAKTDYESRLSRENLESVSREKVLKTRLEEQSAKNHCLEERLFKLEKGQEAHEEEKDAWRETNKSLERQLAMENLQQQENMYRIEKVEKENRRLRHILTDLDLAARLSSHSEGEECGSTEPRLNGENNSDNDNDNDNDNDQKKMVALYESQRQKWIEQTKLLERKMAKSEEEATAIMQKNMELMVALEMAQSSHGK